MLENQKKKNKIHHREAMKCSDYGFQALGETFSEDEAIDPEKIKGIEKREHEGGWYKVKVSKSRNNDILSVIIESEGQFGTQSAVQKKTIQFKRTVLENNDSSWTPVLKIK
jgi:hypothetical protein